MINKRIEHTVFTDMSDLIICASAGHGGIINSKYVTAPDKMYTFDKGTEEEYSFYEGVFNRQLTLKIIEYLHLNKLNYTFINPFYPDIHPSTRGKMCDNAQKELGFKHAFGFEVHANYFYKRHVRGFEIYTSPGLTPADPIATEVYKSVEKAKLMPMRPGITKYDPDVDKEANFAFLLGGNMPLVLIEVDFFSNENVAKGLMNPMRQDKIAAAIARGLIASANKKLYL